MSQPFRSKIKLSVVTLLIGFALLELTLRVFRVPESVKKEMFNMDRTVELEQEPWAKDWKEDQMSMKRNFQAYELFHTAPYQGNHVTVSKGGYRKTSNRVWPAGTRVERIGILGGSAMWGSWVRDEYTAASFLGKQLGEKFSTLPLEVVNYSEIGFVFSQSVHRALRILYSDAPEETPRPRMMIFVTGTNDVSAALDNFTRGIDEPAGLPWEYDRYQYLFRLGDTCQVQFSDFFKKSKAVRFGLKALENAGYREPSQKNFYREPTAVNLKELQAAVAEKYIRLVQVSNGLLRGNGVLPIFVLPPLLEKKNILSEVEKEIVEKNTKYIPYIKGTYEELIRRSRKLDPKIEFYDFTGLFQEDEKTRFVDIFHFSEAGHEKIGDSLLAIVSKHINDKDQTGSFRWESSMQLP